MKNGYLNHYSFGERLKKLWLTKGFDLYNGKPKRTDMARSMFDDDCLPFLVDVDEPQRLNTASNRIKAHLSTESATQVNGEWLNAYCKFFGCSADYLFGYIDAPTKAITDIHNETGLSEAAIKRLQEYIKKDSSTCLDPLNFLLENDNFNNALTHLADYEYNCISTYLNTNERFTLGKRTKEEIRNDFVQDSVSVDALYSREYFAVESLSDSAKEWIKMKQQEVNDMSTKEKIAALDAHIFSE